MLAFFLVSIALISLVHHQWSRQERLGVPSLAAVPNMLLESLENPAASILKSKLLWLGFLIAWTLPTVNMLDRVLDIEIIHGFGIPGGRIEIRQFGLSYGLNTDLLVVGLSYLVGPQRAVQRLVFSTYSSLPRGALLKLARHLPIAASPAPRTQRAARPSADWPRSRVSSESRCGYRATSLRRQWRLIISSAPDRGQTQSRRVSLLCSDLSG